MPNQELVRESTVAELTPPGPSIHSLEIRALESAGESAWDAFVENHEYGSPFHLIAWKRSIEQVFRYRSMYLMAWEGSQLRGVLPLFLVQNLLVGKVLLSTPFAVYGGVLADSPEVQQAFAAHLTELGRKLQVQHVELRNAHDGQRLGFSPLTRYVTFTQDIGPEEDPILESIPRKVRYMVRKALKQEFSTRICHTATAAFEELYAQSLRRLGTPCFPPRFFDALMANFGKQIDVREILWKDQVVSAVLTFFFRDQVLPYYGASDPAHNAIAPNNFMYFDLMRWGGQNGFRIFDFGRSKKNAGGSYDFKCHWGMVERPLPYEMLLVKRKALPDFTPANPMFRAPREMWQKLPFALTRRIGPLFLRLVP